MAFMGESAACMSKPDLYKSRICTAAIYAVEYSRGIAMEETKRRSISLG